MSEVFYVLRHLNGQFVRQDTPSGGYPYLVPKLLQGHMFDSFEQAFNYKGVFSNGGFDSDKWRIIKCDITMTTITLQKYIEEKPIPQQ